MNKGDRTNKRHNADRGVLAIVRDLHAGTIKPGSLGKRERRLIVEHMTDEYTVAEIADVLKVSDRTVQRMRARVRELNALKPHTALTSQIAGSIVAHAENSIARIRRLQREAKDNPAARLEAERLAWAIRRDLMQCLQSLGYITMVPRSGQDSIPIRVPTPAELEAELRDLQALAALPMPRAVVQRGASEMEPHRPIENHSASPNSNEPQQPDATTDSTFTVPAPPLVTDPLTGQKSRSWSRVNRAVREHLPEAPPPSSTSELSP